MKHQDFIVTTIGILQIAFIILASIPYGLPFALLFMVFESLFIILGYKNAVFVDLDDYNKWSVIGIILLYGSIFILSVTFGMITVANY
jgi:hypothetical protein